MQPPPGRDILVARLSELALPRNLLDDAQLAATLTWGASLLCVAHGGTNKPAQARATPFYTASETGDLEMVRLLFTSR